MSARVALKHVAAAANVSLATASLALSGDSRVANATRERVTQAAQRLGYVRDPLLSSLAGGHFRHAGKPILIATGINASDVLPQFQRQAVAMGMALHPMSGDPASMIAEALAVEATALVLRRRGMDAAAIAALPLPSVLWEDETPDEPIVDLVETHEWWACTTGTITRLRAAGFQRPCVVLTPANPRHWHDDVRLAAARSLAVPTLETHALTTDLPGFFTTYAPDVVIGGVASPLSAMRELGIALPFAAMLILDDAWIPNVSGWVIDQESRGRMTLELIEQRLRYGPRPPRRIIIPPRWREGSTLRHGGLNR
jgi:hypothetical protein